MGMGCGGRARGSVKAGRSGRVSGEGLSGVGLSSPGGGWGGGRLGWGWALRGEGDPSTGVRFRWWWQGDL